MVDFYLKEGLSSKGARMAVRIICDSDTNAVDYLNCLFSDSRNVIFWGCKGTNCDSQVPKDTSMSYVLANDIVMSSRNAKRTAKTH